MNPPGIHSYNRQTAARSTFVIAGLIVIWFLMLLGLAAAIKLTVRVFLIVQTGGIWALSNATLPPVSKFIPWILLAAAIFVTIQLIIFKIRGPEPLLKGLGAERPSRDDFFHKRYLNIVEELSVAAGANKPTAWVIPALYKNAFSVEGHICVTEGLLSSLSRDELAAVTAHEFGHIIIGDIQMRTLISGMISFLGLPGKLGSYAEKKALVRLSRSRGSSFSFSDRDHPDPNGAGALAFPALLVAWIILAVYTGLATMLVRVMSGFVSRNYEFQADAMAVKLTRDPVSLARALHKMGRGRSEKNGMAVDPALEMCFIVNPVKNHLDEKRSRVADIFSTHPPLADRIGRLLEMGHVSITTLHEKQEDEDEARHKPVTFEVLIDGTWIGPMAAADLYTKTSIGPQTVIRTSNGRQGTAGLLMARHFAGAPKTGHKCPRCESDLFKFEYEEAHLARCTGCSGVLANNSELSKVIARRITSFSETELAQGDQALNPKNDSGKPATIKDADRSNNLNCPVCNGTMSREFFNIAYKIPVDRCKPCKVVWLDSGELEKIQTVFERLN